jgi:hypothetical protein
MLATGARRQRLGDRAARTGIARTVPIRHRGIAAAAVASTLVLVVAGSAVYVAASDEGEKTCRGHGVRLDDLPGWEEGKTQAEPSRRVTDDLSKTAVTTDHLDLVAVTAYRLNMPVPAGNPSPKR